MTTMSGVLLSFLSEGVGGSYQVVKENEKMERRRKAAATHEGGGESRRCKGIKVQEGELGRAPTGTPLPKYHRPLEGQNRSLYGKRRWEGGEEYMLGAPWAQRRLEPSLLPVKRPRALHALAHLLSGPRRPILAEATRDGPRVGFLR